MADATSNGHPPAGVKRYAGVGDKVTPYHAEIGGRRFTFARRPSASLQIQVMDTFVSRSENDPVTPRDMALVRDVCQAMLHDPDDVDALLDAADLEVVVEVMGDAMEAVTARPTTGSSDSGVPAPPTTPAIGSPEQDSTAAVSPV